MGREENEVTSMGCCDRWLERERTREKEREKRGRERAIERQRVSERTREGERVREEKSERSEREGGRQRPWAGRAHRPPPGFRVKDVGFRIDGRMFRV